MEPKLSAEQIQSAIELAKRITTTYESGGDATWPAIAYALLDVYGRLQEAEESHELWCGIVKASEQEAWGAAKKIVATGATG